jgi:hypothetical protein
MRNNKSRTQVVSSSVLAPDRLYENYPLDYFVGRLVKKSFKARDERHEAMWVAIKGVQEGRLVGELDNDPQVVTRLTYGEQVTVSTAEIISVYYEKDEWLREVRVRLAKGDFFNQFGGAAQGEQFENLYELGLGPAQALAVWRDYGYRFID